MRLTLSAPWCFSAAPIVAPSGGSAGPKPFLGIMNNIYLDFFAPGEQKSCVDLLIRLAAEVPVLQLSCTPDKSAVAALENALKEYKIL